MPSPIAHSAAGFAIYQAYRGRLPGWAQDRARLAISLFIGLSLIPDLDLVPAVVLGDLGGIHNGIANSLIVGVAVSAALGGVISLVAGGKLALWFGAAFLGISLHILMDFFTATRGVMALWPITSQRFVAPAKLFYGVRYSEGWWTISHLWTALTELVFAAAVLMLAVYIPKLIRKSAELGAE